MIYPVVGVPAATDDDGSAVAGELDIAETRRKVALQLRAVRGHFPRKAAFLLFFTWFSEKQREQRARSLAVRRAAPRRGAQRRGAAPQAP